MRGRCRVTAAGRFAAIAAAMAVAAAGCGSSQSSSSTTTATTTPVGPARPAAGMELCRVSQLAVAYAGTDGATGHMEVTIALRNMSRTACRLRGYPGAALLDGTGRRLPLQVNRGGGFFPDTRAVPRPVAMAPGGLAHFGIGFATNNEYAHAHVCRTATAALAAPPGAQPRWQRVSLRRAPRISLCGSRLTVSPVHA
jgi:hypothetical protein